MFNFDDEDININVALVINHPLNFDQEFYISGVLACLIEHFRTKDRYLTSILQISWEGRHQRCHVF
jgi:hypothetical protein